jgi:hypothetical protein
MRLVIENLQILQSLTLHPGSYHFPEIAVPKTPLVAVPVAPITPTV